MVAAVTLRHEKTTLARRLRGVHAPLTFQVADFVRVCQHDAVRARKLSVFVGAATAVGGALLSAPIPTASAAGCPDVEVVFARGTTEDGLGPTGQDFVTALRSRLGAKSVGVYPVDYPASMDFPRAVDGIRDASAHVESTAANCPKTQMVLGGFSQGAAVMGFVTANVIPDGAPQSGVPNPMPTNVADHVAAVALFGKPNDRFMRAIGQPSVVVGPAYSAKTIDLCVPDDAICSSGTDFNAHMEYAETGLIDQAVSFTANRIAVVSPPAATPPAPAPAAPPPSPPPAARPPAPAPAAPAPAPAAPAPTGPPPTQAPGGPAVRPHQGPSTLLFCTVSCQVIGQA
jgi:cutinase